MPGWLITHDQCLDGATAAVIAEAAGLTPIFVEPDRVGAGLSQVGEGPVYLADVSLPVAEWRTAQSRIARLLDHHQSALPLAGEARTTIDLARSGAHLFYDFAVQQGWVYPTPAWDRLCYAVERYDLWLPGHDLGQDLNRLFRHLGYEWYRQRFGRGYAPFTSEEGDLLAHLVRQDALFVATYTARASRYQGDLAFPIYGVSLDQEGPINLVAHSLLAQGAALVFFVKPDLTVSGRSDGRVDVARLMEALFHGGGHARAAGGRLHAGEASDIGVLLERIAAFLAESASAVTP
ncbi:MAG: DHHA1 domain-containing protein [Firmicutes bacterium]|nr:DHHA1 domain-containing protein [Bacillota bacterium]